MTDTSSHLTRAVINLDHLKHNMGLLQELAGARPLWPAIKANAYGHGMEIIARHLTGLGFETLCVARVDEAAALKQAGIDARFVLLSASLPADCEDILRFGCEPAICTLDMARALSDEAARLGTQVSAHLMVDTGMGRIGIAPHEAAGFLDECRRYPALQVRALMSHFPCADEADKQLSLEQTARFQSVVETTRGYGIEIHHMANSAGIFDLPDAYFDAVRPGISIYGLAPSSEITNPRVRELKPVLEWKTAITFLKEVPAGTGLSYGHVFHTSYPSLIATVPVGYGDGLNRGLSNNMHMLVQGARCPQVGRITMDQSLIDVTAIRGRVALGDEVVIIGKQGGEMIKADELAGKLNTINYEIVTAIAGRVPRIPAGGRQ